MSFHFCFKCCCICCYQCERRFEKALLHKSSGILSLQPPAEIPPLHKAFHFPQQTVVGAIQTQPKHVDKKHPSERCEAKGDAGTECGPLSCRDKQPIVQFSLCYNFHKCTLDVHLQQVSGFFKNGRPDIRALLVILLLAIDRKDVFEAKATCESGLAVFDKVFEFTGLLLNEIARNKLVFHIYDSTLPTKKQIFGTVVVPLHKTDIYGHHTIYTKEIDRIEKPRKVSLNMTL